MVFDFSSKTGTYPTIVFMPDFEDPLTLTENITLYFDDIILNNSSNPLMGVGAPANTGKASVYPVPFENFLVVDSPMEIKSVVITSAMGRQVFSMDNLNIGSTSINTSQLAAGLYFVTIYPKSDSPYTLKVVKN
jgi:hypothetical protein